MVFGFITGVLKMNWNFQTTYTNLPPSFFSHTLATPVKEPTLLVLNQALMHELGLGDYDAKADLPVLAGNTPPVGAKPFAQAYSGHQFGHFTNLGDGRALVLGEHLTTQGDRFDVQLKGSGQTPYSRRGDGRAALGPMLREYLMSEAMYALGVPTTRSLSVVSTGEPVFREDILQGAVLTRVALSHIRVGTFEYAAQINQVPALLDYTINRHYPELLKSANPYEDFLKTVCDKQARLIAQWMCIGFIHGVMNTDNMLVSGETIDYGPCAFMDRYDPNTVFSSIDRNGRYAYGKQAAIGEWNLKCLAETMLSLCKDVQTLDEQTLTQYTLTKEHLISAIQGYGPKFEAYWIKGMGNKFGIQNATTADVSLMMQFLNLLQKYRADYTFAFRSLSDDFLKIKVKTLWDAPEFNDWQKQWINRLSVNAVSLEFAKGEMKKINPIKIPRNYWVEESLASAQSGQLELFMDLVESLKNPYVLKQGEEKFLEFPQDYQNHYRTFCGT